jgi:hypothetical protein
VTLVVVGALLTGGCVGEPRMLPPRTPPAAIVPPVALPPAPPKPGLGRVVLWSTDGQMSVVAQGAQAFQATQAAKSGELCVTPCVADMPPGNYTLYLQGLGPNASGDVDQLMVSDRLTYYLRAPGHFEHPTWIPAGPTIVSTLGVVLATVGLALLGGQSSGTRTSGIFLVGIGAAVGIGGGVLIYDAQRGKIQKGATTTWSVPMP